MAKRKTNRKTPTEHYLQCPCGAKARVFALGDKGFMAHCAACGALTFFHDPDLLERLRFGVPLCPHQPKRKSCPGGQTTWCPICRVRTFYQGEPEAGQQ